ncbi:tellurite resistance TerB family protein [Muricoccus nepalensis]|nr:TerB N-terminal domain-containing protein [Roseomonas nepalensis]
MPSDLAILQIVGGALLSGSVFLIARAVSRSRDRSCTDALRGDAVPFIGSAEQWHNDAEQRAKLTLDQLVRLEKSLPTVGPLTVRTAAPASEPVTPRLAQPYSREFHTSSLVAHPEEPRGSDDEGTREQSEATFQPEEAIPVQAAPAPSQGHPIVHLPEVAAPAERLLNAIRGRADGDSIRPDKQTAPSPTAAPAQPSDVVPASTKSGISNIAPPDLRPNLAATVFKIHDLDREYRDEATSQPKVNQAPTASPRPTAAEIVAQVLAALPPANPQALGRAATVPERQIAQKQDDSGLSRVFIRETENPASPGTYAPQPENGSGASGDDNALSNFSLRSPWDAGTPRPPLAGHDAPTRPSEQARSASEGAVWIAPGAEITIRHTRISGGMIYVGESLPNPRGWGDDNALINPSLTIARKYQPGDDIGVFHSPEYAHLTSAGRRAYIDWLAEGRSDPKAESGLVLLFFYGLERRLFHEREVSEAPVLVAEVERLLTIYGAQGPFRNHAANFLAAAALLVGKAPGRVEPAPATEWLTEIPLATLLHLGAVLAEGRPLDADDALLWVLGTPEARLRTPGQRCFPELRQVFAARFGGRHPKGLALRTPKRRITATYRAASGSFTAVIPGAHENLPDISGISAPLGELRDLLEASQTDLEAYSRLLGRRPEARGSLEAAVLLPAPLREAATAKAAEETRKVLLPLLEGRALTTIAPRALFSAFGITFDEGAKRPPATVLAQLTQRLDVLGFGFEPDRRYGSEAVAVAADMVLFEAPEGAPVDPERPAFMHAKVTVEVAILAAAADGDVSDQEFDAVIRNARAISGLSPAEALRLEAFTWSLRIRAKGGDALRRLAGLPLEARQAIARSAIAAVLSDGQASRIEVAFLERLYRTLGLPPETVHSALHQGTSTDVRASRTGVHAPAAPGTRQGVALDAERLARIRQETTQVSSLLSGIFADEPEPVAATDDEAPVLAPPAEMAARFSGLDSAHGALLETVLVASELTIVEFETRAKELRLFPEGAIETINDWAFDHYEEPVLEADGDLVIVVEHLRAQLLLEEEK